MKIPNRLEFSLYESRRTSFISVTVTQLQAFVAVSRTRSITAAAQSLVVSQPSVSAAVTALERELGVSLTQKHGRGIRLTEAGEVYSHYAARFLGLLEEARGAAREAAGEAGSTLRIAAVTTAGEFVAPVVMHAFARQHPEIHLELEVGNRTRVLELLAAHAADVAIGPSPPANGSVVGEPVLPNPYALVCPPDDALVEARDVRVTQLGDRRWLLREEGSGTRALVLDYLAEHGLTPRTLTLGSNGAIASAVSIGLGVSLIPRAAVDLELSSGVLRTIDLQDLPIRQWWLLRSSDAPVRPPVQAFIDFVQIQAGLFKQRFYQ